MNKLFVLLVNSFAPLWRKLGADPRALALILSAKLKMDDRGGYVMGQRQQPKSGMEFLVFMFMGLLGCFSISAFFLLDIPADALAIIFSFWLLYVGLMLITEMSENLFDTRDIYILLTRPITDATLSLSRILHIGVFTSKFVFSLGLPVFVFMLFYYGIWPALTFFLCSVIIVVTTMVSTLITYLMLLRYAPADKVRKWVGYLQIVMASFFFILYQLPNILGETLSKADFVLPEIVGNGWGFLFPGFWAAGLWATLNGQIVNALSIGQAALAIFAAVFGLIFYVRQSRDYGQNLVNMDKAGTNTETNKKTTTNAGWFAPRRWLGNILTRPGLERASFNFHWRIMQRDMSYKQQTYPSLVIMPVLAFSIFFKGITNEVASDFASSKFNMIVLLYMLVMLVIVPMATTKISQYYKASWVFMASPIEKTGKIRYGQLASVLSTFFLPTAFITYAVILWLWGFEALLDITISVGVVLIISIIMVEMDHTFPFSQTKNSGSANTIGPTLISFIITPIFGVAHYFLGQLLWMRPVGAVVVWLIAFLLLWNLRRK